MSDEQFRTLVNLLLHIGRWQIFVMILILLTVLAGCAPYVGYSHLSDPNIRDDGYDLICGGVKYREHANPVEATIAGCANVRGGQMFRIDVDYVWPVL